MRITSKGQVTIPLAIRRQAGLLPDPEVEFTVSKGVVILRKASTPSNRGARLLRAMRGKASSRLTTDEIMALTRRG
jgi:AbrB family looped-hinge helix DNA binding protein